MNKLQMDPPLGGGAPPRFFIRAQRVARPPTPWTWTIHEEARPEPVRCSTRLYRSAEDAWAVGHAVLNRLPKSAVNALADARRNPVLGCDPVSN